MNILPKFLWKYTIRVPQNALLYRRFIHSSMIFQPIVVGIKTSLAPASLCIPDRSNIDIFRSYSKSKDKGKDKKNKKGVHVSPSQISSIVDYEQLTTHFQGTIDRLKEDFVINLSLRSTTGTIESLKVPFEGKDYELQELAQIVRKNPKTIVLNMSSFPQAIPDVLKAIQNSGLNLNPQQDGTTLFVTVPKVTKEHREHLAKNANILFRKCADSIKNINNQYAKELKAKKTAVSEDLIYNVQGQINALAEKYQVEARSILNLKIHELTGGKD